MHKLCRIEAERVNAVLQETMESLQIFSFVPPQDHFSVSDDLRDEGHTKLASDLRTMWKAEKQQSKEQRLCIRNVLRSIRDDKPGFALLKRKLGESSSQMDVLIEYLKALQKITKRKLKKTQEEANIARMEIEEKKEREKKASLDKKELEKELAQLREKRNDEISIMDEQIKKLRNQMQYLSQTTQKEKDDLEKLKATQNADAKGKFDETMQKLEEEETKLSSKMNETLVDNTGSELGARKKKLKTQKELSLSIENYDKTMTEKQFEIDALRKIHETEKKELEEKREYFRKWDAERGRISEEEKLIAAENRKKDEAQKVLDDAASAIQKIFRGMQARKATKKGKKRKGKKKKGKKKKKKK